MSDLCPASAVLPDGRVRMYREWAEMAGYLHEQGLFWIVADIIAELMPTGRAAVEAHKTLHDYLGCDWVCLPPATCLPYHAMLCCFLHRQCRCGISQGPVYRSSGESLAMLASSSLSCTVPI